MVNQVLSVAEDPRSAAMTALRLVESVDRECNAEASERRPTLRDIAGADAACRHFILQLAESWLTRRLFPRFSGRIE